MGGVRRQKVASPQGLSNYSTPVLALRALSLELSRSSHVNDSRMSAHSIDTNDAPAAFHFSHGEFPRVAIALTKLECSDAGAFGLAIIVDEK